MNPRNRVTEEEVIKVNQLLQLAEIIKNLVISRTIKDLKEEDNLPAKDNNRAAKKIKDLNEAQVNPLCQERRALKMQTRMLKIHRKVKGMVVNMIVFIQIHTSTKLRQTLEGIDMTKRMERTTDQKEEVVDRHS